MAKPQPLPPLPDLRFEQSYRRAISAAEGSWPLIIYITLRDQVMFPLTQGFVWALAVIGFRSWSTVANKNGNVWGHRFHSWWTKVNTPTRKI